MKESWNRSPNLYPMLNWYLPEETWCHLCSTEQEQEPELTAQSLVLYHLTSDLYTTYCTFRPLCYIVFKLYPGVNANGINILYLLAPVGSLAYTFHHIFLHKDFQRALSYYDNQHTLETILSVWKSSLSKSMKAILPNWFCNFEFDWKLQPNLQLL